MTNYKIKSPQLAKRNEEIKFFYKIMKGIYANSFIIKILAEEFKQNENSIRQIIYRNFNRTHTMVENQVKEGDLFNAKGHKN